MGILNRTQERCLALLIPGGNTNQLLVLVKGRQEKKATVGRKRQMREGETYGAGNDVAEAPLRVEEKTRTAFVLGEQWEPSVRCSSGGGEGWMQQRRGEMTQARWVSAAAVREGTKD